MGRRRKCRNVAGRPEVTVFKPQGVPMTKLYGVVLGLDGFEALRLVDAEGLSQEEAAEAMGVSRPTLCRILGEARSRVARALTQGWIIRIETGQDDEDSPCREQECHGRKFGHGCGRNHQTGEES